MKSRDQIEAAYKAVTPTSRAQWERSKSSMPGGMVKGAYWYPPYPIYMESGEGCYVSDLDGRRLVDFANHHTAMILGHSHPNVLAETTRWITAGIGLSAPTTLEAEAAEALCERVPSVERVRFTNSGTEATLHAGRLARAATGRVKLAKFEGAYHGSHDSLEVSVAPSLEDAGDASNPDAVPEWDGMSRATEDTVILPYNDPETCALILREHKDEIAAVFYDGKPGTLEIPDEFTRFIRDITSELGILMVMDEVISFRVGYSGYQALCDVEPDLTTFGKVIGGGLPVGAFGGRADLMDMLDNTQPGNRIYQSGTYSGNPLTLAAGIANMRALTPEVYEHLDALGERLADGLRRAFTDADIPARVVQRGSLLHSYFLDPDTPVSDYRTMAKHDGALAHDLFLATTLEGFFTGKGEFVLSAPMDHGHIDGLIRATERVLAA
ncbi:MAG: aminotransferase class III-fold pyridoxal phosphate-dependent enzyme [Dehalococcoidia bacterium]|jgi:glutamate-1-semialdehyde 2,1-aminomutase|nr:aminotransferase class III-fold pyridoxal phosphate-dependent enzyme [Dehalococcoidia bacterium]